MAKHKKDSDVVVDDVVADYTLRFVIDDISDGARTEFRASVYNEHLDLLAEGWDDSEVKAITQPIESYYDYDRKAGDLEIDVVAPISAIDIINNYRKN
jgi:hypothetical protein